MGQFLVGMHMHKKADAYFFRGIMVEQKIHRLDEGLQPVHIETIEITEAKLERFFPTEKLVLDVICNAADSVGRAQLEGDLTQIVSVSICHIDPSSGDLVAMPEEVDVKEPIIFAGDDIVRIRYKFEEEVVEREEPITRIEEIHLVHRKSGSATPSNKVTTPRMRRVMQAELGL